MNKPERRHFRIRYPVPDRPKLIVRSDLSMPVADVSERGLRLVLETGTPALAVGDFFRGNLRFQSGRVVPVTGKIIREADTQIVALLEQGVPLPVIMEEQRLLLQKYNTLDLADPARAAEPKNSDHE